MPQDPPDQHRALMEQVQKDLENHPNQKIQLEIPLPEAMALIGLLQLVSRHPELPQRQAQVARNIIEALEHGVATTPAIKQLIAMGWDPQFDTPR